MRVHRMMSSDGRTIAIGRCRGALAWIVLAVVAVGCSDSSPGITDPDHTTPPPFAAALASIDAGSAPVVFVSLPPGSISNGTEARIRVEGTGTTAVTPIVDGGFDPVALPALAGDTIAIEIQMVNGARTVAVRMGVKGRLPPVIVRTVPPKNKRDVPLNARIVIVFSKPVDPIVLTGTGVQLRTGGVAVAGRLEFTDATHTAVAFVPDAPLAASTDYELVVSQAIRDLDGLSLEAPASVTFTTGTTSTPVAGTTRVSVSPSSATIDQDDFVPLVATATDALGNTLTGRAITWSSSNSGVASVATDGVVTGVAAGGPVTITATIDGVAGSASITISTNRASGVTLNYSLCPPVWLAFQDGDGPWTRVTSTNHIYRLPLTSGRGGVAVVSEFLGGSRSSVSIRYFTATESPHSFGGCSPSTLMKTINGTAVGIAATQSAEIFLGGARASAYMATPNFQLFQVPNGVHDLVGYRSVITADSATSDRAIIRRDQNIPHGGSVGTLDFNGAESFALTSATIAVGGLVAGETVIAGTSHYTGACTVDFFPHSLWRDDNVGSSFTATGIPAAQQRATDFHALFVGAATTTSDRLVTEIFHTLAPRTVLLAAELPVPAITSLGGPNRLQAVYTLPPEYNISTTFWYFNGPFGGGSFGQEWSDRDVFITATVAYLAGRSVSLGLPDFSGISGWVNAWVPDPVTGWRIHADGSTSAACTENERRVFASRRSHP